MSIHPSPSVFLSHAHADKTVARRVARQLASHGLTIWLDEAELRLGTQLPTTIRRHVESCDAIVVIASQASASSQWVKLEVEHGCSHEKTIVPLFVEPVATHELFRDHLGIAVLVPTNLAGAVRKLAFALLERGQREPTEPDATMLVASLRQLAKEAPAVQPLIFGCLDGGPGLALEHMDGVFASAFHPLDYTLCALFEIEPTERIAMHAAYALERGGAGTETLRRWIEKSGDGGTPLAVAFSRKLDELTLDVALELLAACTPPNDQAHCSLLHHNADLMSEGQRERARQLVVSPRRDPGGLTSDLGTVALRCFPEAPEIRWMWQRWIKDGCFDGKPCRPQDLAHILQELGEPKLPNLEGLCDVLRDHVRRQARSGNEARVEIAVEHVCANAERKTPAFEAVLTETRGATGTAEWDTWEEREPEVARRMRCYLKAYTDEATGECEWWNARSAFQKSWETEELLRKEFERD